MFGAGGTEILVVLLIALLLFGPQKLPEIARQVGKAMGEVRRLMDDTVRTIQNEEPHSLPDQMTKPYKAEERPVGQSLEAKNEEGDSA
jgi:TatA/E family protein of Tat protein translocase